ncbi:DUF1173 family protein [Paraburkholderia sp. J8-2]|uniref:DUF1173 family protein n=1 Tax=Paraburkholderia sp. J8-2 TaxID=2805440 RepID=UPI002AB763EF|nr:DUF1173 family protein [Paraburkholderia sp. J8-2]
MLITLAGQRFALEDLQDSPAKYRRWFEEARTTLGHALCPCGRRLVIRRRDGLYHLAGWPGEGLAHKRGCDFRKEADEATVRAGYASGAIVERDDGSVDIKADIPMKVRVDEREGPVERHENQGGGGARRASVGLVGMLHSFWERAGLNRWMPGWKRSWSRCRWEVRKLEGRINGEPMERVLYAVPAWAPEERDAIEGAWGRFHAYLAQPGTFRTRGIVIGEIKKIDRSKYGYRIDLRHHLQPFYASEGLVDRARKASSPAFAQIDRLAGNDAGAAAADNARAIALLVVDLSKNSNLRVVDMGVMLTNRHYIPADSSYEVTMADALEEASRAFVKPLRYDVHEGVFPDFRLTDVEEESVVEVWGMLGNREYERRKAEKIALYRVRGVKVLEWDARGPLPDLKRQG